MKKGIYLLCFLLPTCIAVSNAQIWSHYASPDRLVNNDVKDLCIDQFGNLYATTCYDVGWEIYCDMPRWNGNTDTWIDTVTGEGAHIDNSFLNHADDQGNFWFITPNGVFQFDGTDYSYAAGLPYSDHLPLEIGADKNGTLWYSGVSSGGSFYVGSLVDGKWNNISSNFNTDPLDFMKTSPKGNTWAYSTGNLVNITDNMDKYSIDLTGRFPYTAIFDTLDRPILVVPNFSGNAENNLLLLDNGVLKPLDHSGLGEGFYQHAILASDNRIYVASLGQGMRVVDDQQVTSYTVKDGLPSDTVLSIIEDSEGLLWVATAAGIATLEKGVFKTYTTIEGISDIRVQEVLEFEKGDLWFATNKGLFRYKWLFETTNKPSGHFKTSVLFQRAARKIKLSNTSPAKTQYELLNLQGKVLNEGSFRKTGQIKTGELKPGMYLVRLSYDGFQTTERILID